MILIASFILIAGSILWTAFFRLNNKPAYLLALYLLTTANIILTEYIANTFLALNKQGIVFAIHTLVLCAGWAAWGAAKKPDLFGPFEEWKEEFASAARWLTKKPAIALFAGAMSIIYLFGLAQILFIPQNSMDGLSTYMSRVGFWLQNGSFFPWETTQIGQLIYPVNAQLQIFWTVLFFGSDHFAGAIQWLAVLASGLSVWGISRTIGYTKEQSAYASLLYLSFPLILLQSTTVQTDLVTTAFFVIAVYFLISGFKEDNNLYHVLFSISAGLGIGTKKSFLLLVVLLAFMSLFLCVLYKRNLFKKLSFLLLSTLFGIAIFGAYLYVVNWHTFGSPLGTNYIEKVLQNYPADLQTHRARLNTLAEKPIHRSSTNIDGITEEVLYNIPRILYQFVDVSGLPRPFSGYAHKAKAIVARSFFVAIGFDEIESNIQTAPGHTFNFSDKNDATEDAAWYGPLGFLLLFPAVILGSIQGVREKNYVKLIPLLSFIIFLPLEIVLRPGWDPYQGRYFAPIIAISAPLLGELFKSKKTRFFKGLIITSAVFFAVVTVLYNPAKPTLGKFADEFHIWTNDRIFIQTIQRRKERDLYLMIDQYVDERAVLAYRVPGYFLNYPLFGENFCRTLLPVAKTSNLQNLQWAKDHRVDFLLIAVSEPISLPDEYRVISDVGIWQLYRFIGK